MAIARIRTPNEPRNAAWNHEGAHYIGFLQKPMGGSPPQEVEERECKECTTVDRTPSLLASLPPCWPESEDEDDAEWQPNEDGDPLAHSPVSDIDDAGPVPASNYSDGCGYKDDEYDSSSDGEHDDAPARYPLRELSVPQRPDRLPHGTWHAGTIFYTGNRQNAQTNYWLSQNNSMPLEHIASPSCQSFQGINGHMLSVEQMKNCRNVRFLLPKPPQWKPDMNDQLIEENSLFYLSGESNGSNTVVHNYFQMWHSFYPPRHGLHEVKTYWDYVNEGCGVS
jgi:hypothetical protein